MIIMNHEVIIKRDDGTKYKITASVYVESFAFDRNPVHWNDGVQKLPPGKRKWISAFGNEVTPEEIYQAKLELWEKLKPALPS